MEYIHDTTEFYSGRPSAVTLGKFDGFHRGHRKLLKQILALQRQGYYGIVFTIAPENRPVLLLPEEKRHLLEAMGIDCMLRCPFIPEILSMEPEAFVRDVLCRSLNAKYVVVGTDFHFGHNRRGDVNLLNALQKRYGYRLIVIEKEQYQGREISSTFVREALSAGEMSLVENLLGIPYPVEGIIRHGRHLGHALGMPTINLVPAENKLLPPFGVYYSEALISADGEPDTGLLPVDREPDISSHPADGKPDTILLPAGKCLSNQSTALHETAEHGEEQTPGLQNPASDRGAASCGRIFRCYGITNIGRKPTVDGSFAGAETYLYGVDEDLYGRFVRILLHDFRRGEQKFSSVEELKAQMERDIRAGAEYAGLSPDSAHTAVGCAKISSASANMGAEDREISYASANIGAEAREIPSDSVHTDDSKDGWRSAGQTGRKTSATDFPGGQRYES